MGAFLNVLRNLASTERSAGNILAILSRRRRSLKKYRVRHFKKHAKKTNAQAKNCSNRALMCFRNTHFCWGLKQRFNERTLLPRSSILLEGRIISASTLRHLSRPGQLTQMVSTLIYDATKLNLALVREAVRHGVLLAIRRCRILHIHLRCVK